MVTQRGELLSLAFSRHLYSNSSYPIPKELQTC